MSKRIKVIIENGAGRNKKFKDLRTGRIMTRSQFVREIERGEYSDCYYVRKINGIKTPISKPDNSKRNNLG